MRLRYENALSMMCECDEELGGLIRRFVESFPEALKKKIEARREEGVATNGEKRWEFVDDGRDFSVSVGDSKNYNKDYMNLYLTSVSTEDMSLWPRFDGDRLIGYVTFYMYPVEGRGKPTQDKFEFYAKRVDKDVVITIIPSAHSEVKEVAERLERYGIAEIHQRILNGKFKVDTKALLAKNRSGSR